MKQLGVVQWGIMCWGKIRDPLGQPSRLALLHRFGNCTQNYRLEAENQPEMKRNIIFQNHHFGFHVGFLVGGFNPSEKYLSNWKSSPNRAENKKCLKPPPRSFWASMLVLEGVANLITLHFFTKQGWNFTGCYERTRAPHDHPWARGFQPLGSHGTANHS